MSAESEAGIFFGVDPESAEFIEALEGVTYADNFVQWDITSTEAEFPILHRVLFRPSIIKSGTDKGNAVDASIVVMDRSEGEFINEHEPTPGELITFTRLALAHESAARSKLTDELKQTAINILKIYKGLFEAAGEEIESEINGLFKTDS